VNGYNALWKFLNSPKPRNNLWQKPGWPLWLKHWSQSACKKLVPWIFLWYAWCMCWHH